LGGGGALLATHVTFAAPHNRQHCLTLTIPQPAPHDRQQEPQHEVGDCANDEEGHPASRTLDLHAARRQLLRGHVLEPLLILVSCTAQPCIDEPCLTFTSHPLCHAWRAKHRRNPECLAQFPSGGNAQYVIHEPEAFCSSRRKVSGLTPTAVFALATPKSPIDRGATSTNRTATDYHRTYSCQPPNGILLYLQQAGQSVCLQGTHARTPETACFQAPHTLRIATTRRRARHTPPTQPKPHQPNRPNQISGTTPLNPPHLPWCLARTGGRCSPQTSPAPAGSAVCQRRPPQHTAKRGSRPATPESRETATATGVMGMHPASVASPHESSWHDLATMVWQIGCERTLLLTLQLCCCSVSTFARDQPIPPPLFLSPKHD
jgi:hypothetical protein